MAINLFDVLEVYQPKWQISTENPPRPFNEAELAVYQPTGIVENGEYGYGVRLTKKDGSGISYIPVVKDHPCGLGDVVELSKARIVTLCKPGEKDIYRIDF